MNNRLVAVRNNNGLININPDKILYWHSSIKLLKIIIYLENATVIEIEAKNLEGLHEINKSMVRQFYGEDWVEPKV